MVSVRRTASAALHTLSRSAQRHASLCALRARLLLGWRKHWLLTDGASHGVALGSEPLSHTGVMELVGARQHQDLVPRGERVQADGAAAAAAVCLGCMSAVAPAISLGNSMCASCRTRPKLDEINAPKHCS